MRDSASTRHFMVLIDLIAMYKVRWIESTLIFSFTLITFVDEVELDRAVSAILVEAFMETYDRE